MSRKMIYQWVILAKSECFCKETGKKIQAGDKILFIPKSRYYPSQVFCEESNAFKTAVTKESHITGFKTE